MKVTKIIQQVHEDEIIAAIRLAEAMTSGELRVFISQGRAADPLAAAWEQFHRLGMTRTRERNAVLIYLAPATRKFAVIGDRAIHARCGDGFWQELALSMAGHFQRSEFTEGILQGIRRAGELLARHFPRRPGDANELPDHVARD
ncbi:MAG TPA: TPM domain-containing protein [Verrucomicrobiota bacterium]|nr:TPM domain-containing protein [Verrucomicrobiota bacterium]HNT15319.1 TPM domain-containing protein [Verrucomicrobiota bacterium]